MSKAPDEKRPDNVFHGLGNAQDESLARARYDARTARFDLSYRVPWVRSSYARLIAGRRTAP